jgi:hypothetical protein
MWVIEQDDPALQPPGLVYDRLLESVELICEKA